MTLIKNVNDMRTIEKLLILVMFASTFVLGACSDVEGEGKPKAPQLKVESEDYYVQITRENIGGLAFVYRWINQEDARNVITIIADEAEEPVVMADKSILTYNNVRELPISNKELMDCLDTFGLLTPGSEATLTITLDVVNADGTPISSDAEKASKASTIHLILASDIEITNN